MTHPNYPYLLLRTAFSFMTCDGHIDKSEVLKIKDMDKANKLFGDIDITKELETMLEKINLKGMDFLKDYFRRVNKAELSVDEELDLIQVAVDIIYADDEVKSEEVRFLRVLRTMLKVSDEKIISRYPQLAKDFMWDDEFTEEYVKVLYSNYFKNQSLPEFDVSDVHDISEDSNLGDIAE
ncbi:TerB family tellurite resistance protein [Reichenbachiella versicolor]|uniref:TerB family tellurite resistance protein n=1 Tax=Reichenbachiella versicolor TaxID=1821036 RepID=UPI0013A530B1|nr:TerB family tellurite resistance protein [Reichenbachiella versicolor]